MVELNLNRRQFLKLSGATAATLAVVELGFNEKKVYAKSKDFKIAKATVTPTICCYCGVGCGILVHTNTIPWFIRRGIRITRLTKESFAVKGQH